MTRTASGTNLIWRYVVELLERSIGDAEESYREREGEERSNGRERTNFVERWSETESEGERAIVGGNVGGGRGG